jgi:hypothetical protein
MRFPASASFLSVLLILTLAAPAHSQETLPEARTEIVQIDAVVNDSQGNLVKDLTRADFEVLEDGKRQEVTHFQFVGRPSAAMRADEAAPDAGSDTVTITGAEPTPLPHGLSR